MSGRREREPKGAQETELEFMAAGIELVGLTLG